MEMLTYLRVKRQFTPLCPLAYFLFESWNAAMPRRTALPDGRWLIG